MSILKFFTELPVWVWKMWVWDVGLFPYPVKSELFGFFFSQNAVRNSLIAIYTLSAPLCSNISSCHMGDYEASKTSLYKTNNFNYWNCQTGSIPISLILLSSSSNRFSIFKSLKERKYFESVSKIMKQLCLTLISVCARLAYNQMYNESSTHSSTVKAESPMHPAQN